MNFSNLINKLSSFDTIKLRVYAIFLCVIVLLSILNFSLALNFHFYMDDWGNIWYALTDNKNGYIGQFDIHPGNYLVFLPLIKIFGLNPIPYNYIGLLSKIIAALVVGVLAGVITGKKKAFIIASLLYASYFGSLESFMWATARNNVLNLVSVSCTIILFIRSVKRKSLVLFLLSLGFLFLSFYADPARMLFLPGILIVYQVIKNLKEPDDYIKLIYNIGLILLVSFLGIISTGMGRVIVLPSQENQNGILLKALSSPQEFANYLMGIGFLITSYFNFPFIVKLHSNFFNPISIWVGGIFIIMLIIFAVNRCKKDELEVAIFVPCGILLFLLLNWIAFPYSILSIQHRYQIISSAFFVVFLSSELIKIKKHYLKIVIFLVVVNLLHSFLIVKDWNDIRDFSKVQNLINKQLSFIPTSAHPELFILQGNRRLVVEQLAWSAGGTIPYSQSKGLTREVEMPAFAADWDLTTQVYCNELNRKPIVGGWIRQDKQINLNEVYGFKVDDSDVISDVTDSIRLQLLGTSRCTPKEQISRFEFQVYPQYYVKTVKLKQPFTTGVFLKWVIEGEDVSRLNVTYSALSPENSIKEQSFDISKDQIYKKTFENKLFIINSLHKQIPVRIDVSYCQTINCQSLNKYSKELIIK